jgi:hypothetical protein
MYMSTHSLKDKPKGIMPCTELKENLLQVEAESRKNEFAKLLEEHAQVIKELKQMEDDPPSRAVAGPTEA